MILCLSLLSAGITGMLHHAWLFYFIFFAVLGLELRAYTLSHSTSPFLMKGFFKIGPYKLICPGWL
jgi:hypothetical protein